MPAKRIQGIKDKYSQDIERPTIQVTSLQVALYQIELLEEIRDLLKPYPPIKSQEFVDIVVDKVNKAGEEKDIALRPKLKPKPRAKKKAKKKKK